jgi:hypothetical protein
MLAGEVNCKMTSIACGFLNNRLDSCFRYMVIWVSQRCGMNCTQLSQVGCGV